MRRSTALIVAAMSLFATTMASVAYADESGRAWGDGEAVRRSNADIRGGYYGYPNYYIPDNQGFYSRPHGYGNHHRAHRRDRDRQYDQE